MQQVIEIAKWLVENWNELLGNLVAVLMALNVLFMMLPGDQPEKTIKNIADFLAKFSRKK